MKIKKGDTVEVMAGDDKGRRGKVLRVDVVRQVVVVEGVNRLYKHVRPSRRNPQGGRLQVERPIHISNVQVVSPKTDRPTRVKFTQDAEGKKTRMDTAGNVIDVIRHAGK
ncbi:MAG: 50S ribosomal protein L24 [Sedimentisphaerales bacterium]|nr:50S ribosomal protein L24 [Sedimentisphaerales bacterium]